MRWRVCIVILAWLNAGASAPAQESTEDNLDSLFGPQPAQEEERVGKSEKAAPQTEEPAAKAEERAVRRAPPQQVIEEIIVTARKIEENVQDVPISMTALSAGDLQATSTFEMKDLGRVAPNLSTTFSSGGTTALRFQIRGQIQQDVLGTLDPSVGFYDDGVYVARPHGANAAFFDVQGVQVLRGPQGTLFGRNTPGGAVLLTTNAPDFEGFSGSVGGGFGSFQKRVGNVVLNAPLLEDVLALRVAAQTVRTNGFGRDETNDRKIGTEENDLLRLKLLYKPLRDLSILVKGQYVNLDQLGLPLDIIFALRPEEANDPTICCLTRRNAELEGVNLDDFIGGSKDRVHFDEGLKPRNQAKVKELSLTAEWGQPWATVKFIGGVRQNDDVGNRIDVDGSPSRAIDSLQENENLQQSYELQFTGSWFGERLNWAAGVYYFNEDGEEHGTTSAFEPLLSAINPVRTSADIENDAIAGYIQGTYSLTPRLRLTAGVRHTRDGKKLILNPMRGEPPLQSCALPEELRDDPNECKGTFDDSFSNTSFTGAIDYRLFENAWGFDDLLVYTSAATGYRSGGQNLRGTSVETLQPFDEETLLQLEGGFKSEFFGRRVRLNAAGYHAFYDDIQRNTFVASGGVLPATTVLNAAKAEISGAEVELSALGPIDGLKLGASFGLTLARYNEFEDPISGDRSGEKFDTVPDKSYMLSADYTRALRGLPWVDDVPWHSRIDWSWTDDIPYSQGGVTDFRRQGVDVERLFTQDALGILSLRTGVTFERGLDVNFFARNLTDGRTVTILGLASGADFASRLVTNPGREFGFDVTYRF